MAGCTAVHSCRKVLHFPPPHALTLPPLPSLSTSVTLSLGRPPDLSPEECVEAVSAGLGCPRPRLKVSVRASFTQTSGKSFQCCSCLGLIQVDGDSLRLPFTPPALWHPSWGLSAPSDLLWPPLPKHHNDPSPAEVHYRRIYEAKPPP